MKEEKKRRLVCLQLAKERKDPLYDELVKELKAKKRRDKIITDYVERRSKINLFK